MATKYEKMPTFRTQTTPSGNKGYEEYSFDQKIAKPSPSLALLSHVTLVSTYPGLKRNWSVVDQGTMILIFSKCTAKNFAKYGITRSYDVNQIR